MTDPGSHGWPEAVRGSDLESRGVFWFWFGLVYLFYYINSVMHWLIPNTCFLPLKPTAMFGMTPAVTGRAGRGSSTVTGKMKNLTPCALLPLPPAPVTGPLGSLPMGPGDAPGNLEVGPTLLSRKLGSKEEGEGAVPEGETAPAGPFQGQKAAEVAVPVGSAESPLPLFGRQGCLLGPGRAVF